MLPVGFRSVMLGVVCAAIAVAQPALLRNQSADDAARYLAGLPGRQASPFKAFESDRRWIEHARAFDDAWSQWREKQRPQMDAFQRDELSSARAAAVFYPFGGPDVLNLTTFFPDRESYLMVGLEPPGSVSFFKLTPQHAQEQLSSVRATLESVLERSFFVTKQMDGQLRGQVTDGVLAVMLVQLVREGYTILSAAPVTLDPEGKVVLREAKDRAPGIPGIPNPGVAIEFARGGAHAQRILYFTVDLADKRIQENAAFRRHLSSRTLVTFFKSTSYLPHRSAFSGIRSLVLAQSVAVVQDDSGLPFHFFDPARWQVQLFGQYDRPYGSFRFMQQKDLLAAYQRPGAAKKLSFRIGYGYSKQPSNLQVARKRMSG